MFNFPIKSFKFTDALFLIFLGFVLGMIFTIILFSLWLRYLKNAVGVAFHKYMVQVNPVLSVAKVTKVNLTGISDVSIIIISMSLHSFYF